MKAVRLLEYGGQLVFNDVPTSSGNARSSNTGRLLAGRQLPLQQRKTHTVRRRVGDGFSRFSAHLVDQVVVLFWENRMEILSRWANSAPNSR